jgi:hypothetical protein
VLPKFSTVIYNLDFWLVTHLQFLLFFSGTLGHRRTMSEGRGIPRQAILS